jgi:hypothetical protein
LILIAIVVILAAAIIGIVVGAVVHKNQVYVMPNPFKRSSILIPNQQRVFINTHWIYDHIFSKFGNSNQSIYPDANLSLPWNSLPFDANGCGGHNTFCAYWFKPLLHSWARQSYMVSKRRWSWFSDWKNLGASGVNGNFQSQPAAVSFSSEQTNVWVVDTDDRMRALSLKSGVWDKTWLDLAGNFTTPMTACSSTQCGLR